MATNHDIVVLDACVLYPAPLRLANRTDIQPETLARTVQLMNQAVENSLIEGFEHLIDKITLPDPKDRHVLAAANVGHATAIVTYNIKDFGQQPNVNIVHPDDFCTALYARHQTITLEAIQALRQRLQKPCKSAQQLIETYESQGLLKTGNILRGKIDLI